jgi:hypothetical protein
LQFGKAPWLTWVKFMPATCAYSEKTDKPLDVQYLQAVGLALHLSRVPDLPGYI